MIHSVHVDVSTSTKLSFIVRKDMSEIENVGDSQDHVNGTLEFRKSLERIQSVV